MTSKPAGAQVQGTAQEFEGGGDEVEMPDLEGDEGGEGGLEIPELGGEGEDFEGELEEILMMEAYNVGE